MHLCRANDHAVSHSALVSVESRDPEEYTEEGEGDMIETTFKGTIEMVYSFLPSFPPSESVSYQRVCIPDTRVMGDVPSQEADLSSLQEFAFQCQL